MQQADRNADGEFPSAFESEENSDTSESGPDAGAEEAQRQQLLARLTTGSSAKPRDSRPDAWLERRLRVFERSLEILEGQQKEIRAEQHASHVRMDEQVAVLKDAIAALQDESRTAIPSLQDNVKNMRFRLDVVEAVASAALEATNMPDEKEVSAAEDISEDAAPETDAAMLSSETPSDSGEPVFVPDEAQAEAPAATETPAEESEAPKPVSCLDQARKAASDAAEDREQWALSRRIARAKKLANYNKRLLGGIGLGIVVFVVSAGVSFQWGYMDGRAHAAENHSIKHKTDNKAALAPPRELERLAQKGHRDAQLLLALKYYPVGGAPLDPLRARQWLTRAASSGQPLAQYLLGRFDERGVAAPADMAKAVAWYERAAWAGNRKAMNDLAVIFAQGRGRAPDAEEAALWFYRAADNGSADAQFNLGVLYERGLGVPQSPIHAYKWYAVAGAQGDIEAKKRLAVLDSQMGEEDLDVARKLVDGFAPKPLDAYANLVPDENMLRGVRQVAER